jgi:hypothetical protein
LLTPVKIAKPGNKAIPVREIATADPFQRNTILGAIISKEIQAL